MSFEEIDGYLFGVKVSIGTPPVTGNFLLVDNPGMFIRSSSCTECGSTPAFYDPANSTTYTPGETYNFTDISKYIDNFDFNMSFTFGYDDVCMLGAVATDGSSASANLCIPQQRFRMIDTYTSADKMLLPSQQFDGTFGMGRHAANSTGDGWLQRAVEAGLLNSTTWSYEPGRNGSVAGSMLLGGYNQTLIQGNITWI